MLTASQPEEGSIRPLAQRFTVRPRFVGALVVCFHRTGNCLPTPHGGGHPPCMAQSPYASLSGLVQVHPEATLTELCRLLADSEHGVASQSRRQRTLATWPRTRKKRRARRQNAIPRRAKSHAVSIKPQEALWRPKTAALWMRQASTSRGLDRRLVPPKANACMPQCRPPQENTSQDWLGDASLASWRP